MRPLERPVWPPSLAFPIAFPLAEIAKRRGLAGRFTVA